VFFFFFYHFPGCTMVFSLIQLHPSTDRFSFTVSLECSGPQAGCFPPGSLSLFRALYAGLFPFPPPTLCTPPTTPPHHVPAFKLSYDCPSVRFCSLTFHVAVFLPTVLLFAFFFHVQRDRYCVCAFAFFTLLFSFWRASPRFF